MRNKMRKLLITCLVCFVAMTFTSTSAFSASAKNTAALVDLSSVSYSVEGEWYPVFEGTIHTSNDKELIADVSFEVGITTDTTVYSKQLSRAVANAMAKVMITVVLDPGYTMGQEGKWIWDETGDEAKPGPVTYDMRDQTLVAKLAGQLPLVCNDETGICYVKESFSESEIEEEMIRLTLDTLSAHSFNFVIPNCSTGDHKVVVFAQLVYSDPDGYSLQVDPDDPEVSYGFSHAYLGKGSVTIEEVRMVKTTNFDFDF